MMKKSKTLKFLFSLAVSLLLILGALQYVGFITYEKNIMESCQTEDVNYESFDPYCLRIIRQFHIIDSKYIIMISRKDDVSYGHIIDSLKTSFYDDIELDKTRVIWSNAGIEMTFSQGQILLVPKEKFIGGR